jgi:hypothetical protein
MYIIVNMCYARCPWRYIATRGQDFGSLFYRFWQVQAFLSFSRTKPYPEILHARHRFSLLNVFHNINFETNRVLCP